MIVSRVHKYVCIGIPRTASKSMIEWLRNYRDEWLDGHHRWQVPEEFQDYLIFTVVRNPYDRAMSGFFAETWEPPKPGEEQSRPESFAQFMAELKAELRENPDGNQMNQWGFVEKG